MAWRCKPKHRTQPDGSCSYLGCAEHHPWPFPTERKVYLFRFGAYHKIGIAEDVRKRFASISQVMPIRGEIVARTDVTTDARSHEKAIFRRYAKWRVKGEWFRFDAATAKECEEFFRMLLV